MKRLMQLSILSTAFLAAPAFAQTPPVAHPLTWITLGTQAGPVPNPKRSQPANLLLVGSKPWIVDCGDGAMERLAQAGISPAKIDIAFISHLHVDHIGGLQGLIDFHWGMAKTPLTIYGPPGTDTLVHGLVQSLAPTARIGNPTNGKALKLSPADSVKVVIVKGGDDLMVDGVHVRAVQNSHFDDPPGHPTDNGTQSLSYRFDDQSYSIGYTGDTGPSDSVTALVKNVDLLVSEVTDLEAMGFKNKGTGAYQQDGLTLSLYHFEHQHLTEENAGELATAAGVKSLVFTHISAREDTDKIAPVLIEKTRKYYKGPIRVAKDLDRF